MIPILSRLRASLGTRLGKWLLLALLAYVAAAYALPKGPGSAFVFYIGVVPCLLASAWQHGAEWAGRLRRDPAAMVALALVLWSGLTLLWGTDDKHRAGQFAADTVATLIFLLGIMLALADAQGREAMARLLVLVGAGNAVFSIARAFIEQPLDPRLHGWGLTSHPILGAMVIATAYVTALARGLNGEGRRWPNVAAAAIMALFILMTESRGPILAAGAATLFLCAAGPWRWRALAALAALTAIWYALPHSLRQHSTDVLVHRGTSHRLEIWSYALQLIGDRPLFGHGLAANLYLDVHFGDEVTFPHDLYLSLLFYSGVVGLMIFLALCVVLAWRLWRGWDHVQAPWLAALGIGVLVGGLTDLGQITKGPGTMWLILWLPVGLMLGWWRERSALPPGQTA